MGLYGAIDLHSNTNQMGIINEERKRVVKRKLRNDRDLILAAWEPYRAELVGIVVESTYNWYWLVDLLLDHGYRVHLANPAAIQRYAGLKYSDDTHDAFWLAELLQLGILREGYIYPKETRALRDLLRNRQRLVRLRTSLILSLQSLGVQNCGATLPAAKIKSWSGVEVESFFPEIEDLRLNAALSKGAIDYLTQQIATIEAAVEQKLRLEGPYRQLLTLPGVGRILALVIMLETGPIGRFGGAGHYASYCRKVMSQWTSNEKVKGHGNRKNGNAYLAWAFSEAAEQARRHHAPSREFYERKLRQKKPVTVAHSALAHKLARAAFYLLRDNVPFQQEKMFGTKEAPIWD